MEKLEEVSKAAGPNEGSSLKATTNTSRGQILLNVNDIPLPSGTPSTDEDTAIFQSAVLIEDGIHHRSIHHKIDPMSLKIYRIYHSRYIQWVLGLVVFVNLILAFFEYPTSMSVTSDFRFRDIAWHLPQPACGVTEAIEAICLLVFLADCFIRLKLLGWRRFIVQPCLIMYVCAIVVSFLDLIISLSFCHMRDREFPQSLGYTLRIRRFFRPLFFVLLSRVMRKMTKAIALTFPRILTVITLLVIHLYVFAMIGLLVFPRPQPISTDVPAAGLPPMFEEYDNFSIPNGENFTTLGEFYAARTNITAKNVSNASTSPTESVGLYQLDGGLKYFNTVFDAFISLIVLTTASHPDVMVPIYQYNRFSAIYFILFLGIGAYIILNLLIAATYYQFKKLHQISLQKRLERRRVAFRAAFTILARKAQKKRVARLSNNETVAKRLVRELLKKARIHKDLVPLMYHHLETMKSAVLNWPQFCALLDMATNRPTPHQRTTQRPYYTRVRVFQWMQYFIRHRYFRYFSYLVNLVSVIMITIELQIAYVETLTSPTSRLSYYNIVFTSYFTLELILKLIGYGVRGYFRSYSNIYEFFITLSVLILQILSLALYIPFKAHDKPLAHNTSFHILIRLINILILLRLLRVLVQIESLCQLTKFIINLVKNLCGFLGVIVIVYYIFALLGMELFLDIQGPLQDVTKNCLEQQCNTNDNFTYVANDFGDFASSLVTLWDVMVVNNWFIFLENFAQNTMLVWWSKVYFVAWWLVSSIVCINFFTALVVGTFLSNIEEFYEQQERKAQESKLGESSEWDMRSESLEESQVYNLHAC